MAFDRLGRRHPLVYRLTRPPWRWLLRRLGRPTYWDARRHYRYYEEVVRLARAYVPEGRHVLDVGAHETEVLARLDWFESRVALDVRYVMPRPGIEAVVGDFRQYQPDREFDLVLCLQVLEHLPSPRFFAQKLLQTGRRVIVSVPYRWPAHGHGTHFHDPVDEEKLRSWTGLDPLEAAIIDDGKPRLVAIYDPGSIASK